LKIINQMVGSRGALVASRLLLSAIVLPTDDGQERIDPAEIDRFSRTGLGKPEITRALAKAFCGIDYNDPADQFLATIDKVLAKILSPTLPIPSISVDELKGSHGHFSPTDWSIVLDEERVAGRSKSKEGLIDILGTLAHELRHAEQYYAAAKFEASIRRISLYDFLPKAVKTEAKINPSIEGSEEAEFGEFVLMAHINDEIRDKKMYIEDKIENPDISSDDYEYYVKVIYAKLPSERDATSIGRALRIAIDECLKPW